MWEHWKSPPLTEACLDWGWTRRSMHPSCPHHEWRSRKQGAAVQGWGGACSCRESPPVASTCRSSWRLRVKPKHWGEGFEAYNAHQQNQNLAQLMTLLETSTLLFNIRFLYTKKWKKKTPRNQLSTNKVFKKTRRYDELDVWSDKNVKFTVINMFMLRSLVRKMNNIHEPIGNFNREIEMIKHVK